MGLARFRLGVVLVVAITALTLVASASATNLYVSNRATNTVSPFSIAGDGSLTPIPCTSPNCNANFPEQQVFTPDGRYLYVVQGGAQRVAEFAVAAGGSLTPLCTTTCAATGSNPIGATVSPNGHFLYVVNGSTRTVSPYSIGSDGSLTAIPCSAPNCNTQTFPVGAALSPNGRFLYVTNQGSNTISEFSVAADGSLSQLCTTACPTTGTFPVPVVVRPSGKALYVGDRDGSAISPFTINSDGSLTPIPCPGSSCATSGNPNDLAMSPSGKFLYSSNPGSSALSVFAIGSSGSIAPVTCSGCSSDTSDPENIALTPSGRFLYAANGGASTVSPFAINSDGSVSPLTCSGSNCNVGGGQDVFQVVTSPDQAPTASFTALAGSAGQPTVFNGSASSASPGQKVVQYAWSFGDGSSAPNGGPTPSHTYSKPGTYTVTLSVTDDAGCSTQPIYTGQSIYCNGGPSATRTMKVTVSPARTKPACTLTRKGRLTLMVLCNQNVSVKVGGKLTIGKRKFKFKTFHGSAKTGKPLTLKLKLSKAMLAALQKADHGVVAVTLTASNQNGVTRASKRFKLTVHERKPKGPEPPGDAAGDVSGLAAP